MWYLNKCILIDNFYTIFEYLCFQKEVGLKEHVKLFQIWKTSNKLLSNCLSSEISSLFILFNIFVYFF